ncbi:MAG: 16S rRNA (uracil(1498)-N(3))-methyltransferase [Bacteroidetes bacterium]|nr:16S rRNA (uracil(1498)-N(3))-methyltransferase [Bacteroidota bacterium]
MNVFIATIQNNIALLTPEESWHCAKVLRKKSGDNIHLIDGVGNFYEGVLQLVSEKQCTVKITSEPRKQTPRNYFLHLAIAPTKQIDRIEWLIEKSVEIGIDEISFIQCKNSERTSLKTERIHKIVESAVKQSLQARIPKINDLLPIKDFMKSVSSEQKLIAHCFETEKKNIRQFDFKNKSTCVLIGPEGDFTLEEVKLAEENNFQALSLGNKRLRTETAGLYVCNAVAVLVG